MFLLYALRRVLILAVAISFAVGCSASEDPVGSIAVSVNRESVPLGAPIELTLRFDSSPSFTGIDEDYRVLLHFFR